VPSRNLPQRLQDILDMGAEIKTFTAGMSFADFAGDIKTVRQKINKLSSTKFKFIFLF
jgi:uncharacterized protein with HEPN domain